MALCQIYGEKKVFKSFSIIDFYIKDNDIIIIGIWSLITIFPSPGLRIRNLPNDMVFDNDFPFPWLEIIGNFVFSCNHSHF